MKCPKCEADMVTFTAANVVEVDKCMRCQGMWFDAGEARTIKHHGIEHLIDDIQPIGDVDYNAKTEIKCPYCEVTMLSKEYKNDRSLIYEVCPLCYGTFMDAGELLKFSKK